MAKIQGEVKGANYTFQSDRYNVHFKLNAQVSAQIKTKSALDIWATDREHLFTCTQNQIYQGTVIHGEWRLQSFDSIHFEDQFSGQLPLQLRGSPDEVSYTRHLKVRYKPFQKVNGGVDCKNFGKHLYPVK